MDYQTCAYWWPFNRKNISSRTEIDRATAKKGECRRHAIKKTALEGDILPVSRAEQWCGKYITFEAGK
ncbi:MAG: hypothetical protein ABGW81_10580 [Paracoccaceae bacterium]